MPQTFAIQGVAIPLINANYFAQDLSGQGGITNAQLIDRIISLGANEVRLIASYGQLANTAGNTYSSFTPQSVESLKLFTDLAHARGLTVSWNPITAFANGVIAGDNTQDSHMNPSNPAQWFASFRGTVLENARIAESIGAERFLIISDIEQFAFMRNPDLADEMVALIAEVRTLYRGTITSNLWTPDGALEAFPLEIMRALDLLGVALFPKLTTSTTPTLAELEAAFLRDVNGQNIIANLGELAAATGKDIWFADFAQSSYDGWLRGSPQKFDPTVTFTPDNSEQVLGYQAFMNSMMKYGWPWFKGLSAQNISRIDNYTDNKPAYFSGPAAETFWGKPGEQTLRDYFTGAVAQPAVTLRGTDHGETVRAGAFGSTTIYAGRGEQSLVGGAWADTFVAASPVGNVAVHRLQVTTSGNTIDGTLATYQLRVNGEMLPGVYSVGSVYGQPLKSLTIEFNATTPINSIEFVANEWHRYTTQGGRNMSIISATLDGQNLFTVDRLYHSEYAAEQTAMASGFGMSGGGFARFNTSALTLTPVGTTRLKANTTIDGGDGRDTVVYAGNAADYVVTRTTSGWSVQKPGAGVGEGLDRLSNIEVLRFADKSVSVGTSLPTAVESAFANLLRTGSASEKGLAVGGAIDTKLAAGELTSAQAIAEIIKAADATTSVATLAYQFFTGKIPALGGIDYLVSPTGPNPNNLNSAYYQSFNLENRYINFSVNLGRDGEGKARFLTEYGNLSLTEATKKAYGVIFGTTPTDAKVAALLAGGRDLYFEAYGKDGVNGQGTKAAMVGWLLAEAVKADIGMYAKASDAFLTDLADGAQFAIDLIGVYGRPEFNYG